MALIDLFRKLISGKLNVPPSPSRFGRQILLPNADAAEELEVGDFDENAAFAADTEPAEIASNSVEKQILDGDLWGTTFAIEYIDAKGSESFRRVSMRHFILRPGKSLNLSAHCFERDKLREFRFDRIKSVIDENGEVFEPVIFFKSQLQCPIESYLEHCPGTTSNSTEAPKRNTLPPPEVSAAKNFRPGVDQRKASRDGLRILVAIARSDGEYSHTELDSILAYVETEADIAGVKTTDDDRNALRTYLRRQRPDDIVIEKCISRLLKCDTDKQNRFLEAAQHVVFSDGLLHESELQILQNIYEGLNISFSKVYIT